MTQRYKITTQITPTLNSGYDTVAIAVPDDQGDYVRHDAMSHLTEEKTIEQHRAEFEGWTVNSTKKDSDGEYDHYHTSLEWQAWKAARGVKE